MYLKSLELLGFKSFAKKTELNFSTPITAIVGPNGSGKSNIAEAFRFVLGEQSIKSMRGKRSEDLIWNGSPETGRANRASVKLVFDNRQKLLNVDYEEAVLERVIYRDSSSEYLINGSQVRLKDIIELLSAAHIGSSGHHIISQGEADKILNASIRERREMVEDALGLKIYQYKKEESERKLERTEENIKSVESLRREIVPHLKFLKKQVEKIERTIELKSEILALGREYLKREKRHLATSRTALEAERQKPAIELARLESELAKAKELLARAAGSDKKSSDVIALEEKLSALRREKDSLTRESGRIEGAIQSEERIQRREKELAETGARATVPLSEVQEVAQTVERDFSNVERTAAFPAALTLLRKIRELLQTILHRYRETAGRTETADNEKEIKKFQAERQSVEEKLSALDETEHKLNREYQSLRAEIERQKDSSRDAEKAMFRLMGEANEARAALGKLGARKEKLELEEQNFKRDLSELAELIGRAALDFEGAAVSPEEGDAAEARAAQEERRRTIEKMKIRIEDAGAGGGDDVLKEYKEVGDRDAFLGREIEDLEKSAASLKALIVELAMKLDVEFKEGVKKINAEFQKLFVLMFGGGTAALSVVKEKRRVRADTDLELLDDEEENAVRDAEEGAFEGIDIEVSLPRKKIKGLIMLSGGERALTSIALLFAISQVNPPPFIILDETDAALDEANSRKYGDMIENLSKVSQLILITHNRETMSRAGVLYGVTMGSGGVTKLLSVQLEEAIAVAK